MPSLVTEDIVDPGTRTLLGGITVDDGATAAQLAVLRAVVAHLWQRPDLDLGRDGATRTRRGRLTDR